MITESRKSPVFRGLLPIYIGKFSTWIVGRSESLSQVLKGRLAATRSIEFCELFQDGITKIVKLTMDSVSQHPEIIVDKTRWMNVVW